MADEMGFPEDELEERDMLRDELRRLSRLHPGVRINSPGGSIHHMTAAALRLLISEFRLAVLAKDEDHR